MVVVVAFSFCIGEDQAHTHRHMWEKEETACPTGADAAAASGRTLAAAPLRLDPLETTISPIIIVLPLL